MDPSNIPSLTYEDGTPINVNDSLLDLDKLSNFVSYQGFIQQSLPSFRSNFRLNLVLGYILAFGIFCLAFLAKNLQYSGISEEYIAKLPLSSFKKISSGAGAGDEIAEYSMSFSVEDDVTKSLLVYFEWKGFYQSFHSFLQALKHVKSNKLEDVFEIQLGEYYPFFDNVHINPVTSGISTFAIVCPIVDQKFGQFPIETSTTDGVPIGLKFPSKWGLPSIVTDADYDHFKNEHLARFCQWLNPSPFPVATKIIGTVKDGMKKGTYTFHLSFNPKAIDPAEFCFIIKKLDAAGVKPELQAFLLVFMIISYLIALFLLLMRYLFPRLVSERDISLTYRSKLKL